MEIGANKAMKSEKRLREWNSTRAIIKLSFMFAQSPTVPRDHRYHFEPRPARKHTKHSPIIKDSLIIIAISFISYASRSLGRRNIISTHICYGEKSERAKRQKKRNFARHSFFHSWPRVNFPSALCPLKGHNKNIFVTKEVYIYCDKMEENTRFLL